MDQTPATYTWTIDTTAPQTTIGAGAPPATGTSTGATFNFTASEAGSTFECSLDNAAFAPCTSPRAVHGPGGRRTQFRVRATDAAENVDETPATHNWTITPPGLRRLDRDARSPRRTAGSCRARPSQNYGTDSGLKVDTKSGANARAAVPLQPARRSRRAAR